ncbi:peptidoglycan-recognition protein SB2-like [Macrosteles quadrilineatus]|uniref:peptidoglycan-recognition protein SB2-like n=1 Tax=Macrosteles quadrilineatus TaxID=74068 RepID=UPI0023E1CCF0|nr:peptidoglycan-recognition protein SB2-like [Macrosteles quadrilineatus]
MGWLQRLEEDPHGHDHTFSQYKKKRIYMPDYVSREEWGAGPPWDKGDELPLPAKNVNVYYTETLPCNSLTECIQSMQTLQKNHIEMGLLDISWNFVIGGDGRKYEGRGWLLRPEAPWQVKPKKRKCISIGVVGSLETYANGITSYIQDALADLIHFGICNKYIYCCYDSKIELFYKTKSPQIYR